MRILDMKRDRKLDDVTLYLARSEAEELKDSLPALLRDPHRHQHVPSLGFEKEIAICLYDPDSPPGPSFDERSKKLILHDK
jgi:hypothetical protein